MFSDAVQWITLYNNDLHRPNSSVFNAFVIIMPGVLLWSTYPIAEMGPFAGKVNAREHKVV